MEEYLDDFQCFKISAFSKLRELNDKAKGIKLNSSSSRSHYGNQISDINKNDNKKSTDETEEDSASENVLPIKHVLKELEIVRQDSVKNVLEARINKIKEFSKQQENHKKNVWMDRQQAFIEEMNQKEMHILQALRQSDIRNSNEHAKLVQYYQDMAQKRKKQEQALEEKEKQRQILNANIDRIKKNQQEFRSILQQILVTMKTCTDIEEFKSILGDDLKQLTSLPENVDEVVTKCKNGRISEDEVAKIIEIVTKITCLKIKIEETVNKINQKKKEAEQKQAEKLIHVQKNVEDNVQTTQPITTQIPAADKVDLNLKKLNITKYVSLNNLQIYTNLMEFLENHTHSFKQLSEDTTLKQFKFDCKKAVNIPVNAISGVNAEHVLDKYNRLHKLLSGQNVIVGDKHFNASQHPQGIAFSMDLLAKKFVLQGDLMVSSNPESAFCYASVMVSLWNNFPILGQLILAYFYQFCPYLVPYYIPRQVGETDEDFYTKRGYQYNDGQIEKQDKFLKRMTGMMRLYSALLIVKPQRGQQKTPYDIKHGWRWIASLLKLEPQVDISATMLHTFLETVGFEMEARYGILFQKIIRTIVERFLPSCREKCSGGAVTRLELLITEYMKKRRFDKPNGYLEYSSW